MRPALLLSSVLFAALAGAGAAAAQVATTTDGLRYLSWPGKPPVARAGAPAARASSERTPAAPQPRLALARLDVPTATAAAPRRGLTPASDWLPSAAATQPASQPRPYEATAPRPAPQEPAPLPPAETPPQAPRAETQADPMAPRRDAPIFRLSQGGMATAAPAATPAVPTAAAPQAGQSARFYSVHRQAGHRPDRIEPAPSVYLDALPVEMSQTPSSADLAQPDGPPALIRNRDGSVRAAPPSVGGSDAVDERS